jgi:DNA polymerase III subunit epsilon
MKFIKESGWGEKWTNFKQSYNWAELPLFGVDLETTSVEPRNARIVQCGIVLNTLDGENHIYDWLINPMVPIPLDAVAIHSINDDMVQEKGIKINIAIEQIMDTLNALKSCYPESPLIVCNGSYDITILDRELRRNSFPGLSLDNFPFVIDVLTCDRKLDPWRIGRRTLTAVAAAYGIAISGAHCAVNDINTTIRLARALANKYPSFASCDLKELQLMQRMAHLEWIENYQEFRRRLDDPEFTIAGSDWPMIPYE